MSHYWLVFCFTLTFFLASAQEPRFIQHEIGDINSGAPIHAMLQDHQCMLWIGTDLGLARYDGNQWYPVVIDSSETLAVTALMEDHMSNIWIGTSAGKIFFLDKTRKVREFILDEGHPAKAITGIVQDQNGQIWFATYGEGVYVYTGKRLFNFGMDDGLAGNDIYAITTTSGEVWIGTDDGINICTFRGESKTIRHIGVQEGIPDQIITSLEADHLGNIWIGTFENGVVYYNTSLERIDQKFDHPLMDEITAIEVFDEIELWFGTRKSGLWRYHPASDTIRKLVTLQKNFPGGIKSLLSDAEGNIWIGLEEGVLISAFRPFETLVTDIGEIQSIYSDHNSVLWLGSKNGLYRVEEALNETSKVIRVASQYNFNTTDILEDQFHNLWIGTLDNGLYIFHPPTGKILHPSTHDLTGSTIMSMATTKKSIWMATLQGVISYPADQNIMEDKSISFDLIRAPWQSNLHYVYHVYVDSRDRAWFATDGKGVFCIDGDNVKQYVGNDSLKITDVRSVCEDKRGHMWFNTADQGLVEFDGTHYSLLGLEEGLGTLSVSSIITAGTGDLIITHPRGIELMETDRRHFMYYGDEAGFKDFDPGLNAVALDAKGHVYISGRNMIIKYYSAQEKLSIHPCTQLTGVSIYGQPIDFTTDHEFSYNENYITFDYVGLWYSAPKSVKYQYKLENYDLEWKESKDKSASYSSLPPGDYTFYVKASENKFFLDEPLASYSFTIGKPFWQTYWFLSLMLVSLVGLFYWIVKSREKRSQRQAIIQKDMVESQLQVLKAQINPHFLFNSFNTLITIIDENAQKPEVAIEYVEKLSDFFRSILQYREQDMISLEEEWNLVQNYGYLLEKRYGSYLRLHMSAPAKDAFIIPLTLQMLVENAVKHNIIAENKPLDVFIDMEDDYVTVKNNLQLKSKPEVSTQFGLQSITRRYNLLSDRKVIINTTEDFFEVKIPIIKRTAES